MIRQCEHPRCRNLFVVTDTRLRFCDEHHHKAIDEMVEKITEGMEPTDAEKLVLRNEAGTR